jgi:hypothetical protein
MNLSIVDQHYFEDWGGFKKLFKVSLKITNNLQVFVMGKLMCL